MTQTCIIRHQYIKCQDRTFVTKESAATIVKYQPWIYRIRIHHHQCLHIPQSADETPVSLLLNLLIYFHQMLKFLYFKKYMMPHEISSFEKNTLGLMLNPKMHLTLQCISKVLLIHQTQFSTTKFSCSYEFLYFFYRHVSIWVINSSKTEHDLFYHIYFKFSLKHVLTKTTHLPMRLIFIAVKTVDSFHNIIRWWCHIFPGKGILNTEIRGQWYLLIFIMWIHTLSRQ